MNVKVLCHPSITLRSIDSLQKVKFFKKCFLHMRKYFHPILISCYVAIFVNLLRIFSRFFPCSVPTLIHSLLEADTFITESLFSPLRITFIRKEMHVTINPADVGHFC